MTRPADAVRSPVDEVLAGAGVADHRTGGLVHRRACDTGPSVAHDRVALHDHGHLPNRVRADAARTDHDRQRGLRSIGSSSVPARAPSGERLPVRHRPRRARRDPGRARRPRGGDVEQGDRAVEGADAGAHAGGLGRSRRADPGPARTPGARGRAGCQRRAHLHPVRRRDEHRLATLPVGDRAYHRRRARRDIPDRSRSRRRPECRVRVPVVPVPARRDGDRADGSCCRLLGPGRQGDRRS